MYNLLTEEEINKMFLDNKGLIYYIVNHMGYNQSMSEYEDLVSEGRIGLMKAIRKFDSTRDIKFATWATPCITNEIFMYLRKNKKHNGVISLEEPTADKLCVGDLIEDERAYFVEEVEESEEYAKLIYYILNYLPTKLKCCILYSMAEKKQNEIAEILNLSQSYVSRIMKKVIKKLKTAIQDNYKVKEEFLVKETGKRYAVVFSSKNVNNFKALFLKLLGDFSEEIPNFKWSSNSERSTIQMTISEEAYSFLARFIQEMDEFEITLVSKSEKNVREIPTESKKEEITLSEPSNQEEESQENEDEETVGEEAEMTEESYEESGVLPNLEVLPAVIEEITDYCTNPGDNVEESDKDSNKIPENETQSSEGKEIKRSRSKTSKTEIMRNYIMNLESETFCVADLVKEFPKEKRGFFGFLLNDMKKKNMIESLSRGVYKVIKNN